MLLLRTDWDDYGYRTSFDVWLFDAAGNRTRLSSTKILQLGRMTTMLPSEFESLDENFVSLGQSAEYYELARRYLGASFAPTMTALMDVVAEPSLRSVAERDGGYRTSLLRFSEAEHLVESGGRFFDRTDLPRGGFEFGFSCRLLGFDGDHSISFDFRPHVLDTDDVLPRRIGCLIGKNGTGKSGLIARVAKVISGTNTENEPGRFDSERRPNFSRTICISFSPFQPFRPDDEDTSSYRFIGLRRASDGTISPDDLSDTEKHFASVVSLERTAELRDVLGRRDLLLGDEYEFDDWPSAKRALTKMSSGQRMAAQILIGLIASLIPESLILFDEPESYLHPTLLATLIRRVDAVLHRQNAYAIVATHSPFLLQEIPKRSVRILIRNGATPTTLTLETESLGADVATILELIFAINEDDEHYKHILKKMLGQYGRQRTNEILSSLTLNARAYLAAVDGQ